MKSTAVKIKFPAATKVAVTTHNGGRIIGTLLYPTFLQEGPLVGMAKFGTCVLVACEGVTNAQSRSKIEGHNVTSIARL